MCDAQKNKYLQLIEQSSQLFSKGSIVSENKLQSKNNSLSLINNPNRNLIKIKSWNNDLKFEEEQIFFLKIYQKKFLDLDVWYAHQHEVNPKFFKKKIVYRNEENPINQQYNLGMNRKMKKYKDKLIKYEYFQKIQSQSKIRGSYTAANPKSMEELPDKFLTITEESEVVIIKNRPTPEDINGIAFMGYKKKSPFMSALVSVINSDEKFETCSLNRLIYPHHNSQPCISKENVYHVKLIVNGLRRCFPVDGIVNQSIFYTKKKEVYPFLLQKAMNQIYSLNKLESVDPNLLVYRMIGWIPETLHYMEIGDSASAFDKLLKNLRSFAIIINFDYKDQVLPLLDLEYDEKNKKRKLITMTLENKDPSSIINTGVFGKINFRFPRSTGYLPFQQNISKSKGKTLRNCETRLGYRVRYYFLQQFLRKLEPRHEQVQKTTPLFLKPRKLFLFFLYGLKCI